MSSVVTHSVFYRFSLVTSTSNLKAISTISKLEPSKTCTNYHQMLVMGTWKLLSLINELRHHLHLTVCLCGIPDFRSSLIPRTLDLRLGMCYNWWLIIFTCEMCELVDFFKQDSSLIPRILETNESMSSLIPRTLDTDQYNGTTPMILFTCFCTSIRPFILKVLLGIMCRYDL